MSVGSRVRYSTLFPSTTQISDSALFLERSHGWCQATTGLRGQSTWEGLVCRSLRTEWGGYPESPQEHHQMPGLKGMGRVTFHSSIHCSHCASPVGYRVDPCSHFAIGVYLTKPNKQTDGQTPKSNNMQASF